MARKAVGKLLIAAVLAGLVLLGPGAAAAGVAVKTGRYKETVLTWIGDFNPRMLKVAENLGAKNYRTLATFRYLFDRSKPFERLPIIDKKV
jgi:hypothetical protein